MGNETKVQVLYDDVFNILEESGKRQPYGILDVIDATIEALKLVDDNKERAEYVYEQLKEDILDRVDKEENIDKSQGMLDTLFMVEECLDSVVWKDNSVKSTPDNTDGWILCSEQMPEESEWIGTKEFGTTISNEVYVTFKMPNGERFADHLSFQNGQLSPMKQSEINAFHRGAVPIAWKELPEPYKGDEK